jgi:hypothetical protein
MVLALSGCAAAVPTSTPAEPSASTVLVGIAGADPDQIVLDVSRSGGWCREGGCRHPHLQVRADGSWTVTTTTSADHVSTRRGTLTAPQRDALTEALRTTGLRDDPRAERFCDSWVDGIDTQVRWRTGPDAVERANSCDYQISGGDPLLRFADRLMSA